MRALSLALLLLPAAAAADPFCDRSCPAGAPRDIYGCCASADDGCPPGQVRNEDTAGQCCWEGQAWSVLQSRCVGMPACPPGLRADGATETCVPGGGPPPKPIGPGTDDCQPGQVSSFGHCCWAGQVWQAELGCTGPPRCPPGLEAAGTECYGAGAAPSPAPVRWEPPPEEPLPDYVPVAPDDYVRIEPGAFVMGSPRDEPGRFLNELTHRVTLTRPFYMKVTEVTQAEWRELVGRNPAHGTACGPDCPVERVSWYEALEFLNRLSAAEGLKPCYGLGGCTGTLGGACAGPYCGGDFTCETVHFEGLACPGYRLPTEAEWEYAARAGQATAPALDDVAWHAGNGTAARPVAQKRANPWGLHDTLGNVSEWVWDAFSRYGRQPAKDPVQSHGGQRVVRGGSWASGPREVRWALRGRMPAAGRNHLVGFRAVRTVVEATTKATAADVGP